MSSDDRTAADSASNKASTYDYTPQSTTTTETYSDPSGAVGYLQRLYGQSTSQVGSNVQDVIQQRQQQLNQTDPTSMLIKNSANNQVAAARASGMGLSKEQELQTRRQGDLQAQTQLYKSRNSALGSYQSLVGNMAGNFQNAYLGGQSMALAANSNSKIICSELHRQGVLSDEVFKADQAFGRYAMRRYPNCLWGYYFVATPIVALMKRSKLITKVVSIPALHWAQWMFDGNDDIGFAINVLGSMFCWPFGKVFGKFAKKKYKDLNKGIRI